MAAKGCRHRPLFDIPRRQTAFRVPPIATGPISSAASGCRDPLPLPQVQFPQQPADAGVPPIATGRLFSAASPPAGSGAPVHPTSLSRYPASGVLRGLVGPAQPRLPPLHPPQQLAVPSTRTHGGEQCECRLPDASRRRIGRPGARMGRGWDAWRGGYARGAGGTTWEPRRPHGLGPRQGQGIWRKPDAPARTNLGRGELRDPGARTDSGVPN